MIRVVQRFLDEVNHQPKSLSLTSHSYEPALESELSIDALEVTCLVYVGLNFIVLLRRGIPR
jgi:hypothetical protein